LAEKLAMPTMGIGEIIVDCSLEGYIRQAFPDSTGAFGSYSAN